MKPFKAICSWCLTCCLAFVAGWLLTLLLIAAGKRMASSSEQNPPVQPGPARKLEIAVLPDGAFSVTAWDGYTNLPPGWKLICRGGEFGWRTPNGKVNWSGSETITNRTRVIARAWLQYVQPSTNMAWVPTSGWEDCE